MNNLPHSLFPAYEASNKINDSVKEQKQPDWLLNASFTGSESPLPKTSTASPREEKDSSPPHETNTELSSYPSSSKTRKTKKKKKSQSDALPLLTEDERKDILHRKAFSKCVFIEETHLKPDDAFRVDRKPTRDNFAFKEMHYLLVAHYLKSKGLPLGLTPIESDFLYKQLEKVKKKKAKGDRYFKNTISKSAVPITSGNKKVPANVDFIPLGQSLVAETSSQGIYDLSTQLWTQGKCLLEDDKKGESADHEPLLDASFEKNAEFNRMLREDPKNEKLWLDFVNFQKEFLQKEDSEVALAERKLAILERALKEIPASISLNILKLQVAQRLWESEQLLKAWKQLTFVHPNNPDIWQGYILCVQSHLQYFSVPNATKVYKKCIKTLSKVLNGQFTTHAPSDDLEDRLMGIFFHYCIFLKQAGYIERAIGTVQAMIELNFYPMENMPGDLSQSMPFLEAFWESGMARFGEHGSLGWREVMKQGKLGPAVQNGSSPELTNQEEEIYEKSTQTSEAFFHLENLFTSKLWQPWRPINEEDNCDDPERMVAFEDVQDVLFQIKKEANRIKLLIYLLALLGIKMPPSIFKLPSGSLLGPTCVNFLSESGFDDTAYPFMPNLPHHHNVEDSEMFVSNIFEKANSLLSGEFKALFTMLNLHYLTHQAGIKLRKKELKKKAKLLLKDTSDLSVWAEFVRFCWLVHGPQEATQTFQQIFAATPPGSPGLFYLTHSFVHLALGIDHLHKDAIPDLSQAQAALYFLSLLGANEKFLPDQNLKIIPTLILKAKNGFAQAVERAITSPSFAVLECLSLVEKVISSAGFFIYLSQNIAQAILMYEEVVTKLIKLTRSQDGGIIETLRVQMATLHSLHVWASPSCPLSTLRVTLEQSVLEHPHNTSFWQLLLRLQKQSFLISNTRRLFSQVQKRFSLIPQVWIASLIAEWRRLKSSTIDDCTLDPTTNQVIDTGVAWKIRTLFFEAHRMLPNCPLLWRLHVKFEMDQGNKEKAKAIFFQAVEQCPWNKEVYMDGIAYFSEEAQSLVDTMTEKELRVRLTLQEVQLILEHKKGLSSADTKDPSREETMPDLSPSQNIAL